MAAVCFSLLMLLTSVSVSHTAAAQTTSQGTSDVAAGTSTDVVLRESLETAGLLSAWLDSSGVAPESALVEVDGDADDDRARRDLIDRLHVLSERQELISTRAARIGGIEKDIQTITEVIRDLRRAGGSQGRIAVIDRQELDVARATLDRLVGETSWIGISLDPVVLAGDRVLKIRDALSRELLSTARSADAAGKASGQLTAELSGFADDLARVGGLLDRGRALLAESMTTQAILRSEIVVAMPDLHQRRLLAPTVVGGMTLVTVDAYVRAAAALDEGCPVDWALLAGIGRVESRHGTIDDTRVQESGRVTADILGPLLDGGATEREAAEAAAEEALLAEAAALEAEAEAEAASTFDAAVWGEETLAESEAIDEQAEASRQPVGRAAPVPVVEPTPEPRYDPRIWGDDLPFDEDDITDDDDTAGGDTADGDEDEPEFKGNGFAVIEDSDGGRLDGNMRWDRAVGPMQFLPETWGYWETDGNDDGRLDPQNLYDAAASAGRFLCHLSRTRGPSPYAFVLGYNASDVYVRNVMAAANRYREAGLPVLD